MAKTKVKFDFSKVTNFLLQKGGVYRDQHRGFA
jgi:hypothetical protein